MATQEDAVETWRLASGCWARTEGDPSYRLIRTAQDSPVAGVLAPEEAARLAGARVTADRLTFPAEFAYSPDDGAELPPPPQPGPDWVAPHGAAPLREAAADLAVDGLHATPLALRLDRVAERRETDEPDATLPLPPPGHHEFLVLPATSALPELLALDPDHGSLHLWLRHARSWAPLRPTGDSVLAESSVRRQAWRCVAAVAGRHTRIFLPTSSGLACIEPAALTLEVHTRHLGHAPARGAPMHWGEHVWLPLEGDDGTLALFAATPAGEPAHAIAVPGPIEDMQFGPPVCTARHLIWPARHGQLVLGTQPDGSYTAAYIRWPAGVEPVFEFGSPYLARAGALWQLCWHAAQERYVYLQLGRAQPERHPVQAPRLCSGTLNFRFAARMKLPPWEEPEHGDDSATDEVLMPLLESSASNAAVIGVAVSSTMGLRSVLASPERVRATLVLHADDHPETRFFSFAAPRPWLARVFVDDGKLWMYHPDLQRIHGWTLA